MTDKRPREDAIHLAAQCWQDDETAMIEMDSRLAMAFAKRYSLLADKYDSLLSEARKMRDTLANEHYADDKAAIEAFDAFLENKPQPAKSEGE